MAEDKPLWDRQAWDTEASFKCFRLWLFQEQRPRSLDAAYREHTGRNQYANGTLVRAKPHARNWYQAKNGKGKRITGQDSNPVPTWEDRAKSYDAHLAELDLIKWEQRRAEQREREWKLANKLAASAEKMADWPIQKATVTEYYEDGRTKIVVFEPVNWNKGDAARFAKTSSELGRVAAEMVQSTTKHLITGQLVTLTADDFAKARDDAEKREQEILDGNSNDSSTD